MAATTARTPTPRWERVYVSGAPAAEPKPQVFIARSARQAAYFRKLAEARAAKENIQPSE